MSKTMQVGLIATVCFLLGCLLGPQLPFARAQSVPKTPKWSHGLDLKCRKGGEAEFSAKTTKFGVEVFRDENNGNLIYISETGSIAVVAAK